MPKQQKRFSKYQWETKENKIPRINEMTEEQAKSALCDMIDLYEKTTNLMFHTNREASDLAAKYRFPRFDE